MTSRDRVIDAPVLLTLDTRSGAPLFQQLYEALRTAIRRRQFVAGSKLPSTRALAQQLRVSRNTVHLAFEQLMAEGYVSGRHGSGTYVADGLSEQLLGPDSRQANLPAAPQGHRAVARRARELLRVYPQEPWIAPSPARAFRVVPALDEFPRQLWQRLLTKSWRDGGGGLLDYAWGHNNLRQAIAEYLGPARGVRCTADNVIVVAGAQQGIDLAARVLLDEGQSAWVEDPAYPTAYGALIGAGAKPVAVPVDGEGLTVAAGIRRAPRARLAVVTPSCQFPTGATMSLQRRLELLAWAQRAKAWIVEDDYSSEYRYAGRPLAALQGLDQAERVIYLGTFSKVLFPALRLAYLVVPRDLINPFLVARFFASRHPPRLEQAVLAAFIEQGHFDRHVRRMRTLYAERQETLVRALRKDLADVVAVQPAGAGIHLVAQLRTQHDDVAVARRAALAGIDTLALSSFSVKHKLPPALILGYAGLNERAIKNGVARLAQVLRA
jgi:GntR family transcriptional regulator / MocR family aminotransferase